MITIECVSCHTTATFADYTEAADCGWDCHDERTRIHGTNEYEYVSIEVCPGCIVEAEEQAMAMKLAYGW